MKNNNDKSLSANNITATNQEELFPDAADIFVLAAISDYFSNSDIIVDSVWVQEETSPPKYYAYYSHGCNHYCCDFCIINGKKIVILRTTLLDDEDLLNAEMGSDHISDDEIEDLEKLTMFSI